MKTEKLFFTFSKLIFVSFFMLNSVWAAKNPQGIKKTDCSQLHLKLEQLEKAQNSIFSSFVDDQQMLATSLKQFSDSLKISQKPKDVLVVSGELKKSSEAVHSRSEKTEKVQKQFSKLTHDLVQNILSCLK